jgi:VIT1/CCC1 family predicted Fe2+/Mn2+ transporter
VTAAGASLVAFSVGALVPLLPYLFGAASLALALGLAAVAAVIGGGVVSVLTGRSFLRGAARQLVLGAAAAAITYAIGRAVGGAVS